MPRIRWRIRQRAQSSSANAVRFTEGEAVRVRNGDSDVQAIFLCEDGDERAVILLNMLQREQRISLPRSSLQRLTAHAC